MYTRKIGELEITTGGIGSNNSTVPPKLGVGSFPRAPVLFEMG